MVSEYSDTITMFILYFLNTGRIQVEKIEVEQDRQKAFLDNIVFKNDSIQEFFLEAVQQEDLEKCRSLLQCGANVNQLLKQK